MTDVTYQARTPDFWNAMDLVGGRRSYAMYGSFNDGKGQPSQSNAVTHGCPAARFRGSFVREPCVSSHRVRRLRQAVGTLPSALFRASEMPATASVDTDGRSERALMSGKL